MQPRRRESDEVHSPLGTGAVVLAVCAAGPVASSSAATQKAAAPVTAGSRYLALGDSVTLGYEEGGVVPAPDYHNASTFPGYPEQLGAELHLSVANAPARARPARA